MRKNVIHFFGASGAGTTTLGKYVAKKYNYFFMDTDDYYWLDIEHTKRRPKDECVKLMQAEIDKHDFVVLSGAVCNWGDALIPNFLLVVRVDTDTDVRLERLAERDYKIFGDRIAMGGNMYDQHTNLLGWASRYNEADTSTRSKTLHFQWQQKLPCKNIVVDGGKPLTETFEIVAETLKDTFTNSMLVERFWRTIDKQNWQDLQVLFTANAKVFWRATNEEFSVAEFIEANSKYPGNYKIEIEKLIESKEYTVSVAKVSNIDDETQCYYATSFFQFEADKIVALEEYWSTVENPPEWRKKLNLQNK